MYEISVDQTHNLVRFRLHGIVGLDEMRVFARDLDAAGLTVRRKPIRVLGDLRMFTPATPEIGEIIGELQKAGMSEGVARIAEIVESDVVALQLNRVSRESGTDKMLRRFWDEESALAWLLAADP